MILFGRLEKPVCEISKSIDLHIGFLLVTTVGGVQGDAVPLPGYPHTPHNTLCWWRSSYLPMHTEFHFAHLYLALYLANREVLPPLLHPQYAPMPMPRVLEREPPHHVMLQ